MIYVKVENNNLEKALLLFKKKIKDTQLMFELQDRTEFTKKSTLRRKNKQKAIFREKIAKQKQIG